MRNQLYKITNKTDSRKIAEFLNKDSQLYPINPHEADIA
jgi:hypothetical protein